MKVVLIAALTADGFIARHGTHSADWTSKEDKQLFVRLTKEAGVMIMGSRTFSTIGRALPGRRTIVYTTKPDSIKVADVETTQLSPRDLIRQLQDQGLHGAAICGGSQIYDLFLRAGVVDELYVTVEPKLFGQGVPLFTQPLDVNLSLISTEKLGSNAILLHYQILAS
jgi:dihydrofolate reductase